MPGEDLIGAQANVERGGDVVGKRALADDIGERCTGLHDVPDIARFEGGEQIEGGNHHAQAAGKFAGDDIALTAQKGLVYLIDGIESGEHGGQGLAVLDGENQATDAANGAGGGSGDAGGVGGGGW